MKGMKQIRMLSLLMFILLMSVEIHAADIWVCRNGHANQTGNYCSVCGIKRTADETWICSRGHWGQTGNFCTVCGEKKPYCEKTDEAIDLSELVPFETSRFPLEFEEDCVDIQGNVYEQSLKAYMEEKNAQAATWEINGNYNSLEATLFVLESSKGSSNTGGIRIYGDRRILLEDVNITANMKSYNIQVDVTGVRDLKIEMYAEGNLFLSGIKIGLGDVRLIHFAER